MTNLKQNWQQAKKRDIIGLYNLWKAYYGGIWEDPDWIDEHKEPTQEQIEKFEMLSTFDRETVKRMAMTGILEILEVEGGRINGSKIIRSK